MHLSWRKVLKIWNLKCFIAYPQESLPWFGMIYVGMSASLQYFVKKQHAKWILGETLLSQHFGFLTNCSSVIAVVPLGSWRCFVNKFFVVLNFHENSDISKWKKGDFASYLLHKLQYQLSLLCLVVDSLRVYITLFCSQNLFPNSPCPNIHSILK